MREVFNRNLKVGDLVLPASNGKLYVDNYISKLGILVGENEIYTKRNSFGKEIYKVIYVDTCMLYDFNLSDEILLVKSDLELNYKKYVQSKLVLENKLDELGSGTLFYKNGKEDWSNAYVYIGKINSKFSIISFFGNQKYVNDIYDMCFNDEFLYIPYSVMLSLTLGKLRTTNEEKLENLSMVFDMSKIYQNILDNKSIIPYYFIHKKEALKIDNVISKLNLINIDCKFKMKRPSNVYICGEISFSDKI